MTFTATVSPQSGTNVPTGTVTFLDGSTSLGTATLNASGVATFTTTTLAAGTYTINVTYSGDTNFIHNANSLTNFVVNPDSTNTGLTASVTAPVSGWRCRPC